MQKERYWKQERCKLRKIKMWKTKGKYLQRERKKKERERENCD